MTKLITKISQLDVRVINFGSFVIVGILAPIIIQSPGMIGGVSG